MNKTISKPGKASLETIYFVGIQEAELILLKWVENLKEGGEGEGETKGGESEENYQNPRFWGLSRKVGSSDGERRCFCE